MPIQILDSSTVDKIAAGEVVESPASVIKELVENALDAEADEIVVEIRKGGKSYIRVTDNGLGIPEEEINKSVIRHATSKIEVIDDLYQLKTLGFRGEALSSIAAVSQFEITSRTSQGEIGQSLVVQGGDKVSQKSVGCVKGTTVIVRNLFYNIPARKKFLKSDQAETTHVTDIVTKLSLINPHVSFKYIKDHQIVLSTPMQSTRENIIASVLGGDFSKSLIPLKHISEQLELSGYVTDLNYFRGNRKMQLLFVNGRFISDKNLSLAIERAYGSLLPKGRFPGFVLYLTLDPKSIDVNIHPQKAIVKIENHSDIESLLYHLVSKILREKFLTKRPSSHQSKPSTEPNGEMDSPPLIEESDLIFEPPVRNSDIKVEPNQGFIHMDKNPYVSDPKDDDYIASNNHPNKSIIYDHLVYIGTFSLGYLIFENPLLKELYIMDQHAAHERINYEKLLKQYKHKSISIQPLLMPEVLHLSSSEYQQALNQIELLGQLGFEIEDFGTNALVLTAIPMLFSDVPLKKMMYGLLDDLQNNLHDQLPDIERLIKKACVLSVKISDPLNRREVDVLLAELSSCDSPHTCPHGRPIWIKFAQSEIEKLFDR